MFRQIFYVSVASDRLTPQDIHGILAASRRKNYRRQITGCLLYANGSFAQVLEGEATAVTTLAERIGRDLRHFDLRTLIERDVAMRAYDDWSMGFVHSVDLEDEIRALLGQSAVESAALDVMSRIRPDTVMGAL